MQSSDDYELIYLRTMSSGHYDAIQYAPVYNGELNWQMYAKDEAQAEFTIEGRTHLKLVFVGQRAKLFLNYSEKPALTVEHLRREARPGRIGLWGLHPNFFSNFKYTALTSGPRSQEGKQDSGSELSTPPWADILPGHPTEGQGNNAAPGLGKKWHLSPAFLESDVDAEQYPGDRIHSMPWQVVEADFDGLLPINKYRVKQTHGVWQKNTHDLVWAKLNIHAERAVLRRFEFDFTNKAVLFFNGQPVYAGNNSFLSRQDGSEGRIGWGANALYLALKPGDNELLVGVISESDGWGLMGRFDSVDGIQLR